MESDRTIAWLRQERFIPWTQFHYTTSWVGMATGTPSAAEWSTFGFGGSLVRSGHKWSCYDLETPRLMDIKQPLRLRVVWAPVNAGISSTDDVLWVIQYDQWDFGEACVTAGTALDTAITLQRLAGTTLYVPHRTKPGVINASKFDGNARVGGITWEIEANATGFDFSNDEISFMGLLIDYAPKLCADGSQAQNYKSTLDET